MSLLLFSCDTVVDENGEVNDEGSHLEQTWKLNYKMDGAPKFDPFLVSDSLLIMSGRDHLTSVRKKDGSMKWESKVYDGQALVARNIILNGAQLVSNHIDELIAWDVVSGKELWRVEMNLFDIGYYATTGDYYVIMVDSENLKYVNKQGEVIDEISYQEGYSIFSVTVEGDMKFIAQRKSASPNNKGRITAINVTTRDSVWAFDTDKGGFNWMKPIAEDGIIYAGTVGSPGAFYALDAKTGEEIWEYDRPDAYNQSLGVYSAILEGGVIYFNDGLRMNALDKHTGEELWQTHLDAGTSWSTGIAYHDGYIYKPHNVAMYILDARTGELVHEEMPPDDTYFWGVAAGDGKIFGQTSTQLIAYEPYEP